jgi:CGNR zinc finger
MVATLWIVVYGRRVNFDAYARMAVEIANAPLTSMADLVGVFGAESWLVTHATEKDLTVLRRTQRRLRGVFTDGAGGNAAAAATELNALLEAFPVRPRISGGTGQNAGTPSYTEQSDTEQSGTEQSGTEQSGNTPSGDPGSWHMHVTGRGSSASAEYLAGAIWGLAVWLCEHGSSRFGVCADTRCRNVYLDTSSNCCRRFCSERCATRSHVAAHRARKRAVDPVLTPGA